MDLNSQCLEFEIKVIVSMWVWKLASKYTRKTEYGAVTLTYTTNRANETKIKSRN